MLVLLRSAQVMAFYSYL